MTVEQLIQKLAKIPQNYVVELEDYDQEDNETEYYSATDIEVYDSSKTVTIV